MKKVERVDCFPGRKDIISVSCAFDTEYVNATISSSDDHHRCCTLILSGSRQLVSAINTIVPVCIFARTAITRGLVGAFVCRHTAGYENVFTDPVDLRPVFSYCFRSLPRQKSFGAWTRAAPRTKGV